MLNLCKKLKRLDPGDSNPTWKDESDQMVYLHEATYDVNG